MINFKITIGRKLFTINATKDISADSFKTVRTPVGVQSGLFHDEIFSEDKMLYEKRQKRENRPRMVVEQVQDQVNNAILLPGIDRENVFRPLWVTVPVDNETESIDRRQPVRIVRNSTNLRKFISVFKTWFSYMDERTTRNLQTIEKSISKYIQVRTIIRYHSGPSFGLQPALFDASPLASMEKARYIASRESFSGGGILPGAAWRFPTIKFVLSVPKKNRTLPAVLSGVNTSMENSHEGQTPIRQRTINLYRKSTPSAFVILQTTSFYFFGLIAIGAGVFINFFLLH